MSLFLNALKTLADKPEAGFPPLSGEQSPDNANSSNAPEATAGQQQTEEPAGQKKPEEVPQKTTAPWSSLWQEAVANPTPIEVDPDSPEDVALADLAEIAEVVKSPNNEEPQNPAEEQLQELERSKPTEAEPPQAEEPEATQSPPQEPEIAESQHNPEPQSEAHSTEITSEEFQAQENPQYSEEMKFIFAPWFEAQEKVQEQEKAQQADKETSQIGEPEETAEVIARESASPQSEADGQDIQSDSVELPPAELQADEEPADKSPAMSERESEVSSESREPSSGIRETYWGSEAFDPYAGQSHAEEVTEDSAVEDVADEQGQPSEAIADEEEATVASSDELLSEENQTEAGTTADETWELYDRTTDWSESLASLKKDVPHASESQEKIGEASLAEEKQPEPESPAVASSSSSHSASEIPDSPIAAALASFAAEQMQRQVSSHQEPSETKLEATQQSPAIVVKEKPAASEDEHLPAQQPELSTSMQTSQPVTDIRVTEPYLRLATRLCQSLGSGRPQAIALTSVDQASCKALNIAQLARALTLAEEGNVLVVQGSEARPELAERLGVISGKRPRWASGGGGDLAEKITCNADGRLAMLPHHALRNNQIQLVDPLLLARCKRHYSLVLVETGDLSSEISQSLIAQADIGLITAVLHSTPRERATQAAALLRRLGVRISGCILNEARSAA